MRYFIWILILALAGCGGSSTSVIPDNDSSFATQQQVNQAIAAVPNESTSVAALRAQVVSLQASLDKLQLIGKVNGTPSIKNVDSVREFAMLGEPTLSAVTPVSFGPCADMGVLQGRGGSDTTNSLLSQYEIFKTCVGATYSISTSTGMYDIPPYLAWDGPNCTGNVYLEMDVPQNTMNQDAIKNGLVVQSPLPNDSSVFEINSTKNPPKTVFIQSALNTRPGSAGCQTDQEARLVVLLIPNDVQSTGVPSSITPGSWTTTAP